MKKIPPPNSPTSLDKVMAKEIYNILRPLGDATDQLQSESTTANIVMLAVITAYRRKFILQIKPLIKLFLLLHTLNATYVLCRLKRFAA